jgi:hypothetical protein
MKLDLATAMLASPPAASAAKYAGLAPACGPAFPNRHPNSATLSTTVDYRSKGNHPTTEDIDHHPTTEDIDQSLIIKTT